jgi:hypothetical protein
MNLAKVNFQELYERHLCRHSEYGINVIHLATVIVSYTALFGLAAPLADPAWALLAIPGAYLVLLACNVPPRVLAASFLFMALFFAYFFSLPPLPIWLCLVLLVLAHKVQQWSHRIYRAERDMTEYNKKYRKGPVLFVLLSLYELPLLLNYLVFDRKNWSQPAPLSAGPLVDPGAAVSPAYAGQGETVSVGRCSPRADGAATGANGP